MTITNEKNRKAARVALLAVAKSKGIEIGDLVRKLGRACSVEDYLALARQQIAPPRLSVGDVVVAEYNGTIVCGRIRAFDGSGYCYLNPTHAGSCDHDGRAYDSLCLAPYEYETIIKIGRKPYAAVKTTSDSCGVYGV
jgi:hypothetical protein